jgi:hypothetical protein
MHLSTENQAQLLGDLLLESTSSSVVKEVFDIYLLRFNFMILFNNRKEAKFRRGLSHTPFLFQEATVSSLLICFTGRTHSKFSSILVLFLLKGGQ